MNPAVRSKIPIVVRVHRDARGCWVFLWYLVRRTRDGRTFVKSWRGVHTLETEFKFARMQYRSWADDQRTGDHS